MSVRINAKPVEGSRFAGLMNAFWLEPQKKDVMGYKLSGVAAGEVIPQGTPLKCDEASKTAVVCNHAYVAAVANDKKTLTVKPGHRVVAGAKYAISGANTLVELTVASVSGEDTVVLSAANNSIKAGDILVEVVTTGEGEAAVVAAKNVPNRVASSNSTNDGMIAAAHEAIVLQNVVHYPAEYLNENAFPGSILLIGNPAIRFTIQ